MTLAQRRTKLQQDFAQAQQQATIWATRVVEIRAQLAQLDELEQDPPPAARGDRRAAKRRVGAPQKDAS